VWREALLRLICHYGEGGGEALLKYFFKRLIALAITLFIILTAAFLVIRLMPGSIYDDINNLSPDMLAVLEAKYHFNEPLLTQYRYFLEDIVFRGDWGTSIAVQPKAPVWEVLTTRIPISLQLNIISLIISLPIGMLAGIFAALFKKTRVDNAISFIVVLFISVPSFIFATILQYFLAFRLGWFPIIYQPNAAGNVKAMSMVLPIMALSFGPIARVTRYLRGELIENLSSEYMLLARTKGLTRFQATLRHSLRNSLVPLANIIIPMFTNILTGSLVVEQIFSIAGVGGLLVKSINASDHPLTIAILIFYSFVSLLTILIVDLSYGVIDPRVRIGGGKHDA
jgi:oligopeptide transport system permease protein